MGAAFLAPASADPVYSVTYSNGSVYFQQNKQYNGYGQSYGQPVQWQVQPQQQGYYQQGYYQQQQGYQCPNNPQYSNGGSYQQPAETVWQPVEPPAQPAVQTGTFASEVLRLTNQERAKRGLAPLTHHSALASAANGHSQEMLDLGYFSHTSPTPGRSNPQDRVRLAGANPGLVAENIFQASGYDVAQVAQLAVDNWLESPGHRRNMLDPQATHLGVGFVEQNGTVAVTQVFANRL